MSETTGQAATISVECPCGKRLKAPASAVGRKAKCPKCGNILRIEAPPPPESQPDEFGFDDGALYELAAKESHHADTAEASEARCPNCARLMAAGGFLCTNCGYDVRKGKVVMQTQVESARAAAPAKKSLFGAFAKRSPSTASSSAAAGSRSNPWKPGALKQEAEREPTSGNFIMGLVLGFSFALVAVLVPFFVWWKLPMLPFTGWLVLLVGGAAGIGVNMGYKAGTHVAGATAGAITLLVVIAAKLAVMVAYVAPVVSDAIDEVRAEAAERDLRVIEMAMHEELKNAKLDPDSATLEQELAARRAAHDRVAKMSETEYQKYVKGAPVFEQKKSLVPFVTDEVLKEKKLSPDDASGPERKLAAREARARVEKMSASDREKKLAAAEKEASEQTKAAMAEIEKEFAKNKDSSSRRHASSDDDGDSKSSPGGSLVGFAIIMVIAFFIWAMLPTFVAMSLAWKIAADA